jgi:IMP dehydrogenase
MAKEIIIDPPGFTFQEFSLLTGLTKKDCTITNISLETRLAESLILRIPMLSAAMTSVTGYELALALGKEGGLGILPARLSVDEQADIVNKIKNYEMGFVEEPVKVREHSTIDEVLRMIEQKGHSKVPVVDVNNVFLGVFSYQDYLKSAVSRDEPVTKAMSTIGNGVLYVERPEINVAEAKRILDDKNANYLVVLDNQKRLVKLAFKKDEERLKVGAAISTHEGWQKRVERLLAEDVDLIVVDTSDGYNEFTGEVIKTYKQMPTKVPICAGNIITDDGALYLMQAGADIIKCGMSSGSICTTKREKSVGRAPFTALMEATAARDEYFKESKRYVPVIADGGITGTADMIISLAVGDAVMMGGYFNKFYEAAGEKLDKQRLRTNVENDIAEVATWGEGSVRAQNLSRYGHASKHTFFAEGEEGYVPYSGRLKPALKKDLMKIRAALSNAGSYNLNDFKNNAVLERMSPYAQAIVGDTHNIKVKE